MLRVCLDANIYISAIAFGGKPLTILELALNGRYILVTSSVIIEEANRNLLGKLKAPEQRVYQLIEDVLRVGIIYEPTGAIQYIKHAQDNLVLETALLGNCDVLVTGDKKDLLPLKKFHGVLIESPAEFLNRTYAP